MKKLAVLALGTALALSLPLSLSAATYGQVNLVESVVSPTSAMYVYLAQLGGPHNVYTSTYNIAVTPITPLPFGLQSPIGFCIEAAQWSGTGSNVYNVVDLKDAPNTAGPSGLPMGTAKADWVSRLFAKHYNPTQLTTNSTYASAFQLSIWEIVYDTPQAWDLSAGNIYVSGTNAATTLATTWLNGLNTSDALYGPGLVAFSNDTLQDYVMAKTAVPEPMSILLGAMGLSAVAGFRRLRKA